MQTFLQDLRYGMRQLLRSPGFTAVAVLSLALGIGATTAFFSLVDAVLLKMLPVRKPEDLALFKWASREINFNHGGTTLPERTTGLTVGTSFSVPAIKHLRVETRSLSDLFAFAPYGNLNVSVDGQAEIASGQFVSGNFHTALGVRPALGRLFNDDDDRAAANPVTVISYRYWLRRFGLDPAVLGKSVQIKGVPFTIIGATPAGFYAGMEVGSAPDFTFPLAFSPRIYASDESYAGMTQAWIWWVQLMGRRKPGVSLEQVRTDLEAIFQQSAVAGWEAISL